MSAFLAAVLIPIITDFVKSSAPALSRKFFGESVDDQIKIAKSDTEKLEALSKLDNPYGTPSQWVVDLRGSFRYICSGLLVVGGVTLAITGLVLKGADPAVIILGLDLATAPSGFILGERMVLSYKGSKK